MFNESLISEDESDDEKIPKQKNRILLSSSDYNSSPATSVKIFNVKSPEFIDVENTQFNETLQNNDETNAFLNMTGRLSMPFSQKLRFSDSDETNCSAVSNDSFKSTLDEETVLETQMNKLELLESDQSLFSRSTDDSSMRRFIGNNKVVETLSCQLVQMDLKNNEENFSDLFKIPSPLVNETEEEMGPLVFEEEEDDTEAIPKTFYTNTTISNEGMPSFAMLESNSENLFSSEEPSNEEIVSISKFRSSLGSKKTSPVIEAVKANNSILTISSADSYDSDDQSEDTSEVVVISDTEFEDSFDNVSTVHSETNPSSIPNTLLNNFFDNIPLLDSSLEKIPNAEEVQNDEESIEIPSSSINEESIEIPSSSIEEEHKSEDEQIPSSELEKKSNTVADSQSTQLTQTFDSNTFVSSINISANIKVKLKFSQLDSSDSTTGDSNNDSSKKNESFENESNNDLSKKDTSSEDESIKSQTAVKKTAKEDSPVKKLTPVKKSVKDGFDNLEIDESMQAILNDVYGKTWQTPEILRKCTTSRKDTKKTNPDFSICKFIYFLFNYFFFTLIFCF